MKSNSEIKKRLRDELELLKALVENAERNRLAHPFPIYKSMLSVHNHLEELTNNAPSYAVEVGFIKNNIGRFLQMTTDLAPMASQNAQTVRPAIIQMQNIYNDIIVFIGKPPFKSILNEGE